MYHWKGTDPGDPSAPQLTMYWGRLGSRPWYRISAGTCSTSSSPWHQERPENLIPGAATSTMEREPKGRTPPTLAPTLSAPENPLPSKPNPSALPKSLAGPSVPNSQPRISIPSQSHTHPGEGGAQIFLFHVHLHLSNGRVLVLQGDRAGSPRPPSAVPSPSLLPPSCPIPPASLSQG